MKDKIAKTAKKTGSLEKNLSTIQPKNENKQKIATISMQMSTKPGLFSSFMPNFYICKIFFMIII